MERPHLLFVTGKLAEPALRRVLAELAPRRLRASVAVLPITVAALATTPWIARHLTRPGRRRPRRPARPVRRRPGRRRRPRRRPRRARPEGPARPARVLRHDRRPAARLRRVTTSKSSPRSTTPRACRATSCWRRRARYRADGADVIDLGCDPGDDLGRRRRRGAGAARRGLRVSIDSFNPAEVEAAVEAGAELVLSVNSANVAARRGRLGLRGRRPARRAGRRWTAWTAPSRR